MYDPRWWPPRTMAPGNRSRTAVVNTRLPPPAQADRRELRTGSSRGCVVRGRPATMPGAVLDEARAPPRTPWRAASRGHAHVLIRVPPSAGTRFLRFHETPPLPPGRCRWQHPWPQGVEGGGRGSAAIAAQTPRAAPACTGDPRMASSRPGRDSTPPPPPPGRDVHRC